jgi:hypothetical protein
LKTVYDTKVKIALKEVIIGDGHPAALFGKWINPTGKRSWLKHCK